MRTVFARQERIAPAGDWVETFVEADLDRGEKVVAATDGETLALEWRGLLAVKRSTIWSGG